MRGAGYKILQPATKTFFRTKSIGQELPAFHILGLDNKEKKQTSSNNFSFGISAAQGFNSFASYRYLSSARTTSTVFPSAETVKADELSSGFPLNDSSIESIYDVNQAIEAVERATIAGAKADAWFGPSWAITGLETVHESLGLPWWMSISLFNVSLRLLAFPLQILAQQASAQMVEMNYNLIKAKRLQEAAMKAKTQEEYNRLFKAFKAEYALQASKNGNPTLALMKMPVALISNGFVFISIFTGINGLLNAKVPSMTTGGTAWFEDITLGDPYLGLPVLCSIVTLIMVERGLSMTGEPTAGMPSDRAKLTSALKWIMRAFSLAFIPFGNMVPAGTALLWVSNTCFGVVQGTLLRRDDFRRVVGLRTMGEIKELNAAVAAEQQETKAVDPNTPKEEKEPVPLLFRPPGEMAKAAPPPPKASI
uniref:Membrane insertase YidC/Oxa/ALB C-terminal domain-containing protein n=1 Tax=Polytomella parva TaxID=51329 RepID=A0A7S0VCD6_9CHLO|mmetsp:Transcript_30108/g.55022  ORF Transcript_30108/g.55022 Transcript_30108/m.55022 type:complete len:423 (+) Transcript_30108:56-1324(+)